MRQIESRDSRTDPELSGILVPKYRGLLSRWILVPGLSRKSLSRSRLSRGLKSLSRSKSRVKFFSLLSKLFRKNFFKCGSQLFIA